MYLHVSKKISTETFFIDLNYINYKVLSLLREIKKK